MHSWLSQCACLSLTAYEKLKKEYGNLGVSLSRYERRPRQEHPELSPTNRRAQSYQFFRFHNYEASFQGNFLVTWAKLKRLIRVGRSRKGLWDTGVASMRLVENCIHIGQPNVITGGLPWTISVTITSITIRRTNDPSGLVRFSSWK